MVYFICNFKATTTQRHNIGGNGGVCIFFLCKKNLSIGMVGNMDGKLGWQAFLY